jgi:hypothetical protein
MKPVFASGFVSIFRGNEMACGKNTPFVVLCGRGYGCTFAFGFNLDKGRIPVFISKDNEVYFEWLLVND